jgi:hypothetical protein
LRGSLRGAKTSRSETPPSPDLSMKLRSNISTNLFFFAHSKERQFKIPCAFQSLLILGNAIPALVFACAFHGRGAHLTTRK